MKKLLTLVLALAFSSAMAGNASVAVATLGYDLQGTGHIAKDGDNDFTEVWKSEYFKDYYICGSAVEYNGFLYLSNDPSPSATVLKINVETGDVEEFYTEPSWDNGAPTITDDGYLYVCDEMSNLCKINVETKENVWTVQLVESGNRLTSSAIKFYDGKVFVQVAGKGLFAVNTDGSVAWCYEDGNCSDGWGGNGVNFSLDSSRVYYKDNGRVVAVNTTNGTLAWMAETGEGENMSCREPIVGSDDTVYAITRPGNNKGTVIAFDKNGGKFWETELSSRTGDDGGLAINLSGDTIYASYQDGVTAISAKDGTIKWDAKIGHVRNCVVPINDGGLYAVTEGDSGSFLFYLIDCGTEAAVAWSYQIQEGSQSNHVRPVVLENGDIFCGTPYTIACVHPTFTLKNDNLADAITCGLGSTKGNNTGATVEEGENAAHKASIWYSFTPSEDGLYKIDDYGAGESSGYDAMLSIYTCSGELSFANLTAVVETQDTALDEAYYLSATAGTTYYICWDGYEGSQGVFKMHITKWNGGTWYVAPGATGSGLSPDDPTGDLVLAMESVVSGQTVSLAPGVYSIADYNNQYEIWGAGMTALVFKTKYVTLKGAGPDKTKIVVPEGYVGIRMERDGATLRDLTIEAHGQYHFVNHYNWHMNGALCACNCKDMVVSNVAIYSEAGTDNGALRPFATYSVTDFTVTRVGVEAPNCGCPVFFNKVKDVTVNNLTVSGTMVNNNPAVYCGNWPWGANEGLTFNNVLLANTYMPFTVEADEEVFIYNSIYYNCPNRSNFNEDADVVEEGCANYVEGENDPELKEVAGYILTSTKPGDLYKNVGWHTVPEPAVFGLLALVALFLRRK